jgi:ring-1,2-phenylacetyl-CoA epoxidase subunit PaaC
VSNLRVESAEQAKQNPEYLSALKALLFQIADDDFILAFRGSEWLGLAPHIEEDVAFSSISQDMMGHAVLFYEMLEALGAGKADDLAQLRKPEEFRNAVLVERVNGPGLYLEEPRYDWAYAIVRSYFYSVFKQIRFESLARSSYLPLQQSARKILTEHHYHLLHWRVWMKQLVNSTEEARSRLKKATERAWEDAGGLFQLGPEASAMVRYGLIEDEESLTKRWLEQVNKDFEDYGLPPAGGMKAPGWNGRAGEHTPDLAAALATLSEVYRLDPTARW